MPWKLWNANTNTHNRYYSNNMTTTTANGNKHWQRLQYTSIVIVLFLIIRIVFPLFYLSENVNYVGSGISSPVSPATAIVVLGGGLTTDGQVPYHTQLRLDKAISLYHEIYHDHAIIITLSGGTPHKPNPLDQEGFPVWEATAAAQKLVEMGIPSNHVYEENFSLDTIGNVSS